MLLSLIKQACPKLLFLRVKRNRGILPVYPCASLHPKIVILKKNITLWYGMDLPVPIV